MSDITRVLRGARMVVAAARRSGTVDAVSGYDRLRTHIAQMVHNVQQHYEQQETPSTAGTDPTGPTAAPVTSPIRTATINEVVAPVSITPVEPTPQAAVVHPTTPPLGRHHVVDPIGFEGISGDAGAEAIREAMSRSSPVNMRERSIPSSQLSRLFGFGSLGVRMAVGIASENVSSLLSGGPTSSTMSDQNAERLAETLCRMRGAALKLGQMMSVQDEGMLPPALAKALERVKQNADYMPQTQLYKQLSNQLGEDWRKAFSEFVDKPIAAASIGQVHKGALLDGTSVVVKIQYPGVAQSITSDLGNLKAIVTMTNLLPKGLYIDEIIRVAGAELSEECDYLKEAAYQTRYRALISKDPLLSKYTSVPRVFDYLTTANVITSEFVEGVPIDKVVALPQDIRNAIARTMLVLTMKELFEWRFVQSDPNFANYLYDHSRRKIHCIDFGAAREYRKEFVDGYMRLVWAAANTDRATVLEVSRELGFLTGDENAEMNEAHVDAALIVGEPFLTNDAYNFGNSQLTRKISQYGTTFMKYRLTPPPSEAYSLHRKLAGAFLLCIRLKADIKCRDILESTFDSYDFTPEPPVGDKTVAAVLA